MDKNRNFENLEYPEHLENLDRLEHPEHHGHHHHHHTLIPAGDGSSVNKVFYWSIGLNLGYTILEAAYGLAGGSMGLLSDAGHNLSDVGALLISLLAIKLAARKATPSFSYGFGRATVEASLANAVLLYVAVIFILIESVRRLIHPSAVDGPEIAWVAGAGVVVNGITAWMLMSLSANDLNVKGAFLHMVADTLVSLGVVASGIVISFTDWKWLDPLVGILVAVVIALGSRRLLLDSLRLTLDGTPPGFDVGKVEKAISSVPEVESFHHLHVWAMSTTRVAMTVHVIVSDPSKIDAAIADVREAVKKVGIDHSTIEAETSLHACGQSGLDEPGAQ